MKTRKHSIPHKHKKSLKKSLQHKNKHKNTILSYMLVILLNTIIFEKLHNKSKITHSSIKNIIIEMLEKFKNLKIMCNITFSSKDIDNFSKKLYPIIKLFEVLYKDKNNRDDRDDRNEHKYTKTFNKNTNGGGAYLGHIIDKGDKPITGNDFKKAVDDISQILSSVMFAPALTERFGVFGVTTLMDIFQGNDDAFKEYFKWHLSDEYVDIFPPKLKMDKILELLPSIQNYLNVYFTHEHIKNQALVDEGKLSEAALKPSALEQLSEQVFSTEMSMQMALVNPTALNKGFNPSLFVKGNI